MMPVVGVLANIVDADIDQSTLAGAGQDAGFEIRGKNFWQEGENLKLHAKIVA
jgi:hypothetical protein